MQVGIIRQETPGSVNSTTDCRAWQCVSCGRHLRWNQVQTVCERCLGGQVVSAIYQPASATQPGFTIGSRNGATAHATYMQDVAIYSRALRRRKSRTTTSHQPAMPLGHRQRRRPGRGLDYDNDGVANGIAILHGRNRFLVHGHARPGRDQHGHLAEGSGLQRHLAGPNLARPRHLDGRRSETRALGWQPELHPATGRGTRSSACS